MSTVNRVILIGRLGQNPDLRATRNGRDMCLFSIATEHFSSRDEKKVTTWHNIVVFGETAKACGQFLKVGSSVYVEGEIRNRKYNKEGVTQHYSEIHANAVRFLGGREAQNNNDDEL